MNAGLRRWLLLVALLTGVGMAKVAQQTSLSLAGYRVGRSYAAWHTLENDTVWLRSQVLSMRSPMALAQTMRDKHVTLVAWSSLPGGSAMAAGPVAPAPRASAAASKARTGSKLALADDGAGQ